MKYTIKDLREGKCAVINDGTLEQLQDVLKKAFPNDVSIPEGGAYYYGKEEYDSCLLYTSPSPRD